MDDRLRLSDYLSKPVKELPEHHDFDERYFWVASELNDMPMSELEQMLKEHKRANQSAAEANPTVNH